MIEINSKDSKYIKRQLLQLLQIKIKYVDCIVLIRLVLCV